MLHFAEKLADFYEDLDPDCSGSKDDIINNILFTIEKFGCDSIREELKTIEKEYSDEKEVVDSCKQFFKELAEIERTLAVYPEENKFVNF